MTTRGYKLTDLRDRTMGGTQWGEGVSHSAPGIGPLCTEGWIHLYDNPMVAMLMDPIHGHYGTAAHLWEVEWSGATMDDHGLKRGAQHVTTLHRGELPKLTTPQRVRIAILCAKHICANAEWTTWADRWLSGQDRTNKAAGAAAAVAWKMRKPWAALYAVESAYENVAQWAVAEAVLSAVKETDTLDLVAIIRQAIEAEKE